MEQVEMMRNIQTNVDEALGWSKDLMAELVDNGGAEAQIRRLEIATQKLEEAELWMTKMW